MDFTLQAIRFHLAHGVGTLSLWLSQSPRSLRFWNLHSRWHRVIRWALAGHGIIHVAETILNIYERAYLSACLSLFSSAIMILGAFIDFQHHKEHDGRTKEQSEI